MAMIELTRSEKINMNIKDIAKQVKQQLKKEYLGCVFSVTIERYSMGQSLHVNLMTSDFKVIRDFKDIPEFAYETIGSGYTKEQIEQRQNKNYHQLNGYSTVDDYDKNKWCNGVFLTERGHNLFKRVCEIINQYNYDDSDPITDYYNVNFYISLSIGKWNKSYVLESKSKSFIVNSKDLFDKKKNPNLSLSAKDIEENPNIPKYDIKGKRIKD